MVENMLGSLLCFPAPGPILLDPCGSTMSETTSEAWSVEVLPSDSGEFSVYQRAHLKHMSNQIHRCLLLAEYLQLAYIGAILSFNIRLHRFGNICDSPRPYIPVAVILMQLYTFSLV